MPLNSKLRGLAETSVLFPPVPLGPILNHFRRGIGLEVWIWEGGSRGPKAGAAMLQRDARVLPCGLRLLQNTVPPKSNKIANFTVFHNILNKHERHAFLFLASNINLPVASARSPACEHTLGKHREIAMPDLLSLLSPKSRAGQIFLLITPATVCLLIL